MGDKIAGLLSGDRIAGLHHRDPTPLGYSWIVAYAEHESVALLAAPDAEFPVSNAITPMAFIESPADTTRRYRS